MAIYIYVNTQIFLVHVDKKDPRKDPIGHLLLDAPEMLIGLLSSFVGCKLSSVVLKNNNKSTKNLIGFFTALVFGYAGYNFTKKLK